MNLAQVCRVRKFIAILVTVAVLSEAVVGDALAVPPARPVSPLPFAARTLAPRNIPAVDPANLAPLLSRFGTISGLVPPAEGKKWIIQIQDVHGNPTAQKSAESALALMFESHGADALVLEGQTRALDPQLFGSAPDAEIRDMAADQLFSEGKISGAAHFIVTHPSIVPSVLPLEDESVYRGNVEALRNALNLQPAFQRVVESMSDSVTDLKKRHYNAEMYVVDLAIARYQAGDLPLTSVLALLRHRGQALSYVMSALLRANSLETLYQVSEVGSELQTLLGRLRGRISDADASVLFDAAFRFQKGQVGTGEFVSTLMAVTSRNGISINDFPNLSTHLERTLLTRSIDPEKLIAAVSEIQDGLPLRLAVTPEEKDIARLSHRVYLLSKLASLSASSAEWAELCTAPLSPVSTDAGVRQALRRCAALERAMSPAKDFYRCASQRNESFGENLALASAGGAHCLVVVAGGFHSSSISTTARRLGFGYVAFTPLVGDARAWDASGPLRELARPLSPFDAAMEARGQTLTARPLSNGNHARIAAAAIARGTLNRDKRTIQWGRDQLGYFQASLSGTRVVSTAKGKTVEVTISFLDRIETISVEFSGKQLAFSAMSRPFVMSWRALVKFMKQAYYRIFGVPIMGVGLHTGKPVQIRIVPKPPGSGIRAYRTDISGSWESREIPIVLSNILRGRRRHTGAAKKDVSISMVEHLLFAMRSLDIWDADIYVDAPELPMMDGSARQYIDALKIFENWSPKPQGIRLQEPVVFQRDDNTMIIRLPLEEDEIDSHYIFALNFGEQLQEFPVEFEATIKEADLGESRALLGSAPTLSEREFESFRGEFFQGAVAYQPGQASNPNRAVDDPKASVVMVSEKKHWTDGSFEPKALSAHKVMDGRGDEVPLFKTVNGIVKYWEFSIGSGHRDNREVNELTRMCLTGYKFEIGYERVVGALRKAYANKRLSREVFDKVMARLSKFKDYDSHLEEITPIDAPPVASDQIDRLGNSLKWVGDKAHPLKAHAMARIKDYFLNREGGAALATVAHRIATPQFQPAEASAIEIRVSEELAEALVCEVTFVLPGLSEQEYPRIAMVVGKPGMRAETTELYAMMSRAAKPIGAETEDISPRVAMAGLRNIDYFPLVGPLKSETFARQWLPEYARFRPDASPSDLDRQNDRMKFSLLWEGEAGKLSGRPPDEMRRKDVAKAVAAMLTVTFIRLRAGLPRLARSETVPMSGQIVDTLDLRTDILYDTTDGRAALAYLRSTKMASASTLLDSLFHLSLKAGSPEREWQPFANDIPSLLRGVEQALTEEFGREKGRAGAIVWYERYLSSLPTGESVDVEARFPVTKVFSFKGAAQRSTPKEVFGQPIVPEVRARLELLRNEQTSATSFAVMVSMVRGLSAFTGYSREFLARLAPYTEGALFAVLGLVNASLMAWIFSGVVVPGIVAAGMGLAIWFIGHRTVLVSEEEAAVETPFGSLDSGAKRRVLFLGFVVAVAPAIGFSISPLLGIAVAVVGTAVHEVANRSLRGRPLRFLDGGQRGMMNLQRQV